MKRFFVIGLLALMFASCYEDKGNYTYTKVMSWECRNMNSTIANRAAIFGERYTAYPPVEFYNWEKPEDTLRMRYIWVTNNAQNSSKLDTLCVGRQLDWICDRVASTLGIYLFIEDTVTGQCSSTMLQISASSKIGKGWLFLHDYGYTDMSFIRPYTEQIQDPDYPEDDKKKINVRKYADNYRNYLSTVVSPNAIGTNPKNVILWGNNKSSKLLLLQDVSVNLDGGTWAPEVLLSEEFAGGMPEGGFKDMIFLSGARLLHANDGRVYRMQTASQAEYDNSFYAWEYINVPMQDIQTGKDLIIDRFIDSRATWYGRAMCALDGANNRMLWTYSNTGDNTGALFYPPKGKDEMTAGQFVDEISRNMYVDLADLGQNKMLIFGQRGLTAHGTGSGSGGGSTSHLAFFIKNPDGKILVQLMSHGYLSGETVLDVHTAYRPAFQNVEVYEWTSVEGATDDMIDENTVFCFEYGKQSANDFLYFAKDNVVYCYDFDTKRLHKHYEFENPATKVKFLMLNPQDTELGVYADDNTFRTIKCGALEIINPDFKSKEIGVFTDLKNVVAMEYTFANIMDFCYSKPD